MPNSITETRQVKRLAQQLSREEFIAYEKFKDDLCDGILTGEKELPSSPNNYYYQPPGLDRIFIYSVSNPRFNQKQKVEQDITIESLKNIGEIVKINSGFNLQDLANSVKRIIDQAQLIQFIFQLLTALGIVGLLTWSQVKPGDSSPKLDNRLPANSLQNQKQ